MKRLVAQGFSERRSCALIEIARSLYHYAGEEREDEKLVKELKEIARKHPRYGYRRAWALLRRGGQNVNLKRVHRLWRKEKLSLPARRPRKRVRRGGSVPLKAEYPNHVWTYDFMQDQTSDGRKLKILTIVDEYTRESPAIRVERRMPSETVVEVLKGAFKKHGAPEYLRSDNGPEFIAEAVQEWLAGQGTKPHYIDPASPWQNAFGESFNDKVRSECLNLEIFDSLEEAKIIAEGWRREYNEFRPHSSLGYLTPREYRAKNEGSFPFARPQARSARRGAGGGQKEKTMVMH